MQPAFGSLPNTVGAMAPARTMSSSARATSSSTVAGWFAGSATSAARYPSTSSPYPARAGDRPPLVVDRGQLVEADLVDVARLEASVVQRAIAVAVERVAVGRRHEAGLLARRREVLARERLEIPPVGRVHDVAHHLAHALAVLVRGDLRQGGDDRLLDRRVHEPLELVDRPLGDDPGRRPARGAGLVEDLDVRVHERPIGPQPVEPALEPLGRVGVLERGDLWQQRLGAVDLVDRADLVDPQRLLALGEIGEEHEHAAGHPILDRQRVLGDRLRRVGCRAEIASIPAMRPAADGSGRRSS